MKSSLLLLPLLLMVVLIPSIRSMKIFVQNNFTRSVYNPGSHFISGGITYAPEIIFPGTEDVILLSDEDLLFVTELQGLLTLHIDGQREKIAIGWKIPISDSIPGNLNQIGLYWGNQTNNSLIYTQIFDTVPRPNITKGRYASLGWFNVKFPDESVASVYMTSDSSAHMTIHLEEGHRKPTGTFLIQSVKNDYFLRHYSADYAIFDNFEPAIRTRFYWDLQRASNESMGYYISSYEDSNDVWKSVTNTSENAFLQVLQKTTGNSFLWIIHHIYEDVYTIRSWTEEWKFLNGGKCADMLGNIAPFCKIGISPVLSPQQSTNKQDENFLFRLIPAINYW